MTRNTPDKSLFSFIFLSTNSRLVISVCTAQMTIVRNCCSVTFNRD